MTSVDVLAIGAHPDDVELGCGGTLLALAKLGKSSAVIDLTRGELGSRGTPRQRVQEAQSAARLLGLAFRENLQLEDGEITVTREARLRLIEIIRTCRPRLVITHSATGHPDHGQTCRLVREAVHHSGLARIGAGGERHRPDKIAYWLEFRQSRSPEIVVDVSGVYEEKEAVLRCYRSQLHQPDSEQPETYLSRPDFLDQIRAQARHFGSLVDCQYGEGFLLSRLPRVGDLSDC